MYVFIGDFSTNFKKTQKKGCFAPLCVPLGLKKPGDFTVSEGIRLQIFKFFGRWVWSEGKKKSRHGRNVFDRHGHSLVLYIKANVVMSVCVSNNFKT
jgi:hypothetical protein